MTGMVGAVVRTALIAGLAMASSCAWLQPAWMDPHASCGVQASRDLAGVDWSEVMEVAVVISSGEFQPMVIDLRRERPYRFVFDNRDDETRVFYAPSFLHASAIGGVVVDGEVRDEACMSQLLVPPMSTAEIRLVPVRRGSYGLADSLVPLDLWGAGLGTIRVE